jgi:hypothetical protein
MRLSALEQVCIGHGLSYGGGLLEPMDRDIQFENSIIYLIPNAVILCDFSVIFPQLAPRFLLSQVQYPQKKGVFRRRRRARSRNDAHQNIAIALDSLQKQVPGALYSITSASVNRCFKAV